MKLGQYSCGCIGLDDGKTIFKSCDGETVFLATHREMKEPQSWVALPSTENEKLIGEINGLITDGHRFREIKRILNGGGV